jgi:hypothetical protein
LEEVSTTSGHQPRPPRQKVVLLLVSITVSAALFLALDWIRTARIQRHSKSTIRAKAAGRPYPCRVPDPVRQHAFKPNCVSTDAWGPNTYQFATNNLGFRDEETREVPLADPRPRILMLGDSFTEGMISWDKSYVGRIATRFPQYDFLNGGVSSYSPSNYLNVARSTMAAGVEFDEVIVFIDNNDAQDEAAFYRDVDASGAVDRYPQEQSAAGWYMNLLAWTGSHLALTDHMLRLFDRLERPLVERGFYHLPAGFFGAPFDMENAAWTYRKVNETAPWAAGFAPLGVEGGIAREKAKMTLLWQELARRSIPISVVVYPYASQLVHDQADSRQVRIWREWCEGKCKRFISVFPVFFAARDECPRGRPGCWYERLFIFGDGHYSAAGYALVADAVIQSLTEEPPVKRQLPGIPAGIRNDGR